MNNLNDTDRERVGETFERGVNDFTEDDLNRVRENAETAERKSTHLGQQVESFRLTWSLLQDYWAGNTPPSRGNSPPPSGSPWRISCRRWT